MDSQALKMENNSRRPKEIKLESIFNDEKKEGLKRFILEHKKKQIETDWEENLFDFIDFYPCILPHELFEWLTENYEIPKKRNKNV